MTVTRDDLIDEFLAKSGWAGCTRAPLAGDASNRRYSRLNGPHGPAVLMDAPPEKSGDIRSFVKISRHLREIGLSAPQIFHSDAEAGLILLEDLGDDLFARVLESDPTLEGQLYIAAIDALIVAQQAPIPSGLAAYDVSAMTRTAMLLPQWYMPAATGETQTVPHYETTLRQLLTAHMTGDPVLVQRDYHAENLLWLPNREGPARVGLLDFQDAMTGHPAYDLASLLKDARRDVSPGLQDQMVQYFIEKTGVDAMRFRAAYAVCSAQRNLRIIGVFTRLAVRDGKLGYADLLPRVWTNLIDDLRHHALVDLRAIVDASIPAPSPEIIAKIKSVHG